MAAMRNRTLGFLVCARGYHALVRALSNQPAHARADGVGGHEQGQRHRQHDGKRGPAAAALASCSKRARRSGSPANCSGNTLTATSRSSRVSRARDLAHAAGAERFFDFIGAKRVAGDGFPCLNGSQQVLLSAS